MVKNTIRIVSHEEKPGFEHFPVGSILRMDNGADVTYMVIKFMDVNEPELLCINSGVVVDKKYAEVYHFTLVKEINIKSE